MTSLMAAPSVAGPNSELGINMKAKLLRSLVKEYIPTEKHPFTNHCELSYVVSTIQTHNLLSEFSRTNNSASDDEAWKAAIDYWLNRLLTLASSNSPDKCWAGICLLGLTCQECSLERFSASYGVWLTKLLPHIQAQEGSHLVKSACCASLSDFLTRLSGLPNAKKDATSQASKIIQPLIKLLAEDVSSVLLEEALTLLSTMIKLFPFSVNRHYDSVEAVIVSRLMSGKCNASALEKLGNALALLPQSRGDEDSWSFLMLKILFCVNNQLDDAFQGLEEEYIGIEIVRLLLPAGKESLPPLGGLTLSELNRSELSLRRPERLLGFRISMLMNCCSNLLRSSYPVMVPLPVHGLVALARRVLMVDGSLFQSSNENFMSTMKQEFICSELPLLHLHSLDILMAVVKGLSSQLLPHAAEIVRLLMEYLTRCTSPNLKIKVYSIVKVLLMSMGIGFAIHLNQDIINNAFIDLDFVAEEKSDKTLDGYGKVQENILNESHQRKRKHSNKTVSAQEEPVRDSLPAKKALPTPISVKRAALETLEALLTVGGSVRSESWRENVDHLLITVATYAYKGGLSHEEQDALFGAPTSSWTDFRLATLRALLASLLSPGRGYPSHLGLSLELFRRGVRETGTEVSQLCGQALLSLEVLIHPRSLALLDYNSSIDGQRQAYTFQPQTPSRVASVESDLDDDLNEKWLGNNDESEFQVVVEQPEANHIETNLTAGKDSMDEDYSEEVRQDPKASELRASTNPAMSRGVVNQVHQDDPMAESPQNRNKQIVDSAFSYGIASNDDEFEPLRKKVALLPIEVTGKNETVAAGSELKVSSSEFILQDGKGGVASIFERISSTLASSEKMAKLASEPDNELSEDVFPDIVDTDPDSD